MKLGIGLPNTMAPEIDRELVHKWARLADEAGFDVLGAIDKPNFDSWDPLTTLAGVALVTERARLATSILLLPPRNEVLVAKQAAVVDQLSGGRLVLGLAQGSREDDYELFGVPEDFKRRSRKFERQIGRIREVWRESRESDRDHGVVGPPPVQDPGPRIWAGALTDKAMERAARAADGYIFGTRGADFMKQTTPKVREVFAAQGKNEIEVAGLAYVAVGDDPQAALEEGAHHVVRYYGRLWTEPENLIHHGPAQKIAEEVQAYAGSGIDTLILFAQIPRLEQVEQLAEHVLPAYRSDS